MGDLTKDYCFANLLGNYLLCPSSESLLKIHENMSFPQTFEMQRLLEEREQLNKIDQETFLRMHRETQRLISSGLANNFLDEFEDKTIKLKDHPEESKPSDTIPGNSVGSKLICNAFSILSPNVPVSSDIKEEHRFKIMEEANHIIFPSKDQAHFLSGFSFIRLEECLK